MPITLTCPVCNKTFSAKPCVALRKNPCCSVVCANSAKTTDPIKRFWSKVNKLDPDECWDWLGYKDKDGYGTFNPTSKTLIKAHRFSYMLANGSILNGLSICHSCDNPGCCNPQHLFSGTPADNDADRDLKGRMALGENTNRTNLTQKDVLKIRSLYEDGLSEQSIANKFGLSQTGISGIIRRRTWKHI